MDGVLFRSGVVEMWMRDFKTLGGTREEYQVRSPQLGLAGTWHTNYSDAEREFREQVALNPGPPSPS